MGKNSVLGSTTGIRHCLSVAFNSQSNGCAERGVGQIKNLLEKIGRKGVLNQDELNKLVFKLNSHVIKHLLTLTSTY